jgi:predicted ATPase
MIEKLGLRNFKSIIEADVELSDFTVLVGANGSGKSNLVEALAFLAAIPSAGVAGAVNRCGGFGGIVPKVVGAGDLRRTLVSIRHRTLLPQLPEPYCRGLPRLAVEHELQLAHSRQQIVRVAAESITFHQALAMAEALVADPKEELTKRVFLSSPSRFIVKRGPRGGVSYSADPPISRDTLPLYLEWLGLRFLKDSVRSPTGLKRVVESIGEIRGLARTRPPGDQSLLDPGVLTVVEYAQPFRLFRSLTGHMRAYDLLLSELRYEQPVSDSRELSSVGLNMPSVVRYLRPENEASWSRIMSTLGAIAPHVTSMRPSSLRTGKEYVEFSEAAVRRPVESWQSSDGTLRALAILLAVETHTPGSTILIEEPEQNLHPWAIRAIVDHIREAIKERNVQVIVTTHSPQVLERVHPRELLVASRTKKGGTVFRRLEDILPRTEIVMGEVADLWVKGLLGGVPSDE